MLSEIIGDLPVVNNNHELFARFYSGIKAIFHKAEFSAQSDISFRLKIDWRRVDVKKQKKISFRAENSS